MICTRESKHSTVGKLVDKHFSTKVTFLPSNNDKYTPEIRTFVFGDAYNKTGLREENGEILACST